MAGNGNDGKSKKGLFGKLREAATNVVFTASDQPSAAPETAPEAPRPTTAAPVIKSAVAVGKLDAAAQEFQEMLKKNVAGKGAAFNTFVEMLDSLKDIIPDESTRYKAALTAVSKQGINADQILRAITVLMSSLESEDNKFKETLSEQQAVLSEQEKELPEKDEQIAQLKKQIEDTTARLRQQISNLENEKSEIRQKIESARAKHDTILSSFSTALDSLKNDLGNASVNVQKYLKGGE